MLNYRLFFPHSYLKLTSCCCEFWHLEFQSNECLLLGWRHFVVGRFDPSQLGLFVLQVQGSPAQQEGHGVLTKLGRKKKQSVAGEHCSRIAHTSKSLSLHLCGAESHPKHVTQS